MKNELRIGNLLKVKYTDSEFKDHEAITRVVGVHEEDVLGEGWNIEVEAIEENFEDCECDPLEITSQILIQNSGFIKKHGKL